MSETEAMENVSGLVKEEKLFSNKMVSDHVTLSTTPLMEIESIIQVSTNFYKLHTSLITNENVMVPTHVLALISPLGKSIKSSACHGKCSIQTSVTTMCKKEDKVHIKPTSVTGVLESLEKDE